MLPKETGRPRSTTRSARGQAVSAWSGASRRVARGCACGTTAARNLVLLARCLRPGPGINVRLSNQKTGMTTVGRTDMDGAQAAPEEQPAAAAQVPLAIELRHLRYFVALADAGNFTRAAERMFIAQPTLSQQIRRLEEIVGTRLLQRRRDGLRLTKAGTVLLDASRTVLSLVDHEVNRTRQAAGLGRSRLRVVVPPRLPDVFAVEAASALRSAAAAADVEIAWLEAPLDAEFSLIRQRRADAGLGWLTASPEALPAPLDVMSLGDFEPDVWVPSRHQAARRGTISLDELARMDVVHGPRRLEPGIYDAWTRVLRTADPRFEFTDPPLRH